MNTPPFTSDPLRALVTAAALVATLVCAPPASAASGPILPTLTSDSSNPRIPGKFVWADLVTDDVVAARKFYGRLFGWSFWDAGGYMIASNDGRPMAGMFQRPRPKDRAAEPRWFGYISVPNVKSAQSTVTKNGGQVLMAAQNMPKRGEQAVCADPEGAVFGLVKSSTGDPDDFLPDVGDWVWIELLSRDARKAGDFYRSVAGYDIVENQSARVGDYIFVSKGFARAAALTFTPQQTKAHPTWLLFVRVKDLNASLAQAKELGGRVVLAPKPDLLQGKLAVVADPTGAAVGIMEWGHEQMKGAQ